MFYYTSLLDKQGFALQEWHRRLFKSKNRGPTLLVNQLSCNGERTTPPKKVRHELNGIKCDFVAHNLAVLAVHN